MARTGERKLLHSPASTSGGDAVETSAYVAAGGATGLTSTSGVEWRTYLHGLPVDPRLLTVARR